MVIMMVTGTSIFGKGKDRVRDKAGMLIHVCEREGLISRNPFGWRVLLNRRANLPFQLHQNDDANRR